jgi:hypothetical protein
VSGKCRRKSVTRFLASVASCTFVLNTSIILVCLLQKPFGALRFFLYQTGHGLLKKFCLKPRSITKVHTFRHTKGVQIRQSAGLVATVHWPNFKP